MINDSNPYEELRTEKGILTFRYQGKLLYSKYNPQREAEHYFASLGSSVKKDSLITFCGADFMNLALLQHRDIKRVFSFEPVAFPHLSEHHKIIRVKSIKQLQRAIETEAIDPSEISIVTWPAFLETQRSEFLEYLTQMKNLLLKSTLSQLADSTFSKLEHHHIEKTSARLTQIHILTNEKIDSSSALPPAVVLSSGASLARQLELLLPYFNKVITFAYPSALPFLYRKGIVPDYAIAVDPGYPTYYHLIKNRNSIKLLCPLSLTPSIFHLKNYDFQFFHYGSAIEEKLFHQTNILKSQPEGSVAFNLFRILTGTGYEKIILIGQDFCYVNQRSHVKGGLFEIEQNSTADYFSSLEDKIKRLEASRFPTTIKDADNPLKTDTAMAIYYQHFLERAEEFPLYLTGEPENRFSGRIPYLPKGYFQNLPTINKEHFYFKTKKFSIPQIKTAVISQEIDRKAK